MLTYIKGDLFNSPAQVLVNAVNTVGVMGKGIALEFKKRDPDMFELYKEKCNEKSFNIGNLLLWKKEEKWILLFPTKSHWREPSKLKYIEEGLKKFAQSYDELGIESIAFPKLGCGNGGLDWNDVKPLMEKYLSNLPIHVYVYLENYRETAMECNEKLEMEKWLISNVDSIGFNLLKETLKLTIERDKDILLNNNSLKHIYWLDERIHLINGNEIIIHENELFDFWNYIRNIGIIDIDKLPERFIDYGLIMLDIFKYLDYVQPIVIVNSMSKQIINSNGYQYIS